MNYCLVANYKTLVSYLHFKHFMDVNHIILQLYRRELWSRGLQFVIVLLDFAQRDAKQS